ncbi:O-antigen ligase family protein [Candidatus Calescamantes bacterium]|nr:O-antigen ligase family protein [Candidatus Calescamantes bacterium]
MERVISFPLIILFVLLPLAISPFTYHPGTLSYTLILLFIPLAFFQYCLLLFKDKIKLKFSPLYWLLFLHSFFLLLTLSFSPYFYLTAGATLLYFLFFLLFFLSSQGLEAEEEKFYLYSLIPVIITFFLQLAGLRIGGARFTSTLGQKNLFALYLCSSSLFLVKAFLEKRIRFLFYILYPLLIFAIIFSRSRSGWLTFVLMYTLYFYFLSPERIRRIIRHLFILVSFLLISLILINFLLRYREFTRPERLTIPFRLYVWKSGWKMFLARPLLGWGRDTFPYVFPSYREKELEKFVSSDVMMAPRAHNEYLQVLVEEGIVGFILFLLFWILILKQCWDKKEFFKFSLISGLLFHGVFSVSLRYPLFLFLLYYFGGKVISLKEKIISRSGKVLFLLSSGVVLIFSTAVNFRMTWADYYLQKGVVLSQRGKIEEAEFYMEKALTLNPFSPSILYKLGKIEFLRKNYDKAEYIYKRLIFLAGDYVEVHANLARVYFMKGEFEKAIKELDIEEKLHPGLEKYKIMKKILLKIKDKGIFPAP